MQAVCNMDVSEPRDFTRPRLSLARVSLSVNGETLSVSERLEFLETSGTEGRFPSVRSSRHVSASCLDGSSGFC